MQQLIITTTFRFLGQAYNQGEKPVEVPDEAAALALKEGWAVVPGDDQGDTDTGDTDTGDTDTGDTDTGDTAAGDTGDAQQSKSLGNAPENQAVGAAPENK